MDTPYILVVAIDADAPSTVLFFTNLAGRVPLRIVRYPGPVARALAGASAVVFVRALFEFRDLMWCAGRLGIPCYYFLDDNFVVINDEADIYSSIATKYSKDEMRAALRGAAGVLAATESLQRYVVSERLHGHAVVYPPVAGPPLEAAAPSPTRPLTIAFFAGVQRRPPFVRDVYPAVRRLARDRRIRLVAAGIDEGSLPAADGVDIVYVPYEPSYVAALERMACEGVDILVHPSFVTANNLYKNPHVLINAHLLGAVPVFGDAPPYDAIAADGVAVVCGRTEDEWYEALRRLVDDDRLRDALRSRLAEYCARHFDGEVSACILGDMLRAHTPPPRAVRLRRSVAGTILLGLGRARHVAGQLTSRMAAP